jgi:hypothetical protein
MDESKKVVVYSGPESSPLGLHPGLWLKEFYPLIIDRA